MSEPPTPTGTSTWKYTGHPHIANASEWHEGQPKGYEVYQGLAQYDPRNFHLAQQTGRQSQRIVAGEWDDELLHNVGTVKSYTDRSPKGYLNANTDFVHND